VTSSPGESSGIFQQSVRGASTSDHEQGYGLGWIAVLMANLGEKQAGTTENAQGVALGIRPVFHHVATRVSQSQRESRGQLLPPLAAH
jgi:hypothetical protein